MGRLYSGNLNAFKAACGRIEQLDFVVIYEECHDSGLMKGYMHLRTEDRAGRLLIAETFSNYDEDVLYNTATEWLNRTATQLEQWSKA